MSGLAVLRGLTAFERLYRMWGETRGGITHETDRKAAEEISAWTGELITPAMVKDYRLQIRLVARQMRKGVSAAQQETLPLAEPACVAGVASADLVREAIELLQRALRHGGEI